MTRMDARWTILAVVNKRRREENAKRRTTFLLPPFYMRHLQRAVCVARRNRLVSDDILITAGFNPTGKS